MQHVRTWAIYQGGRYLPPAGFTSQMRAESPILSAGVVVPVAGFCGDRDAVV